LKAAGTELIVYVDSGSTDGSVEAAKAAGAHVLELDMARPFTAARARNEGLALLGQIDPDGTEVQFVDGDCELREGWLEAAQSALNAADDIAVVCGRRRERFPEKTLWNRLIDAEWDTPVGEATSCGGDALMRRAALADVGGYRNDLIAGEEPEMCFRMRAKGWRILRIDAEMTWHDAAMTRFGQWWKRNRRAGHAFAENATLHGKSPERFRVAQTRSVLIWGALLPAIALLGAIFISPWALFLLLAWPLQALRMAARGMALDRAWFITIGKLAEAQGALGFFWGRLTNRRSAIIEYK
jgi:GT2 family glycosyltransferase